MTGKEALEIMCGELVDFDLRLHDLLKTQEQYDDWFNGEAKQKSIEFTKKYGSPVAIIKKDLEVLEILKDKEVDINFFKTLIPFHKEEDLMINYNATHWKGKLTLEETIKIKEWLDGK